MLHLIDTIDKLDLLNAANDAAEFASILRRQGINETFEEVEKTGKYI